jgi:predicted anti-sigma-YlaC factor YlaD
MHDCEHYETLLSTWLDGELDHDGQIEALDHLVRCEPCRDFHREIRALDGWVAALREPAGTAAAAPARRVSPAWAWRAAAVLVVALGVWALLWRGGAVAPAPAEAEISLGRGTMTEHRFVELTREVLQADRRYHAAMYEVMRRVVRETTPVREASLETGVRAEERPGPDGAEAAGRNPA